MTSPEVYRALFWMVAGGYVIYLGWTITRIVAYRAARRRHPSSREAIHRETSRHVTSESEAPAERSVV